MELELTVKNFFVRKHSHLHSGVEQTCATPMSDFCNFSEEISILTSLD